MVHELGSGRIGVIPFAVFSEGHFLLFVSVKFVPYVGKLKCALGS